MLRSDLLDSIRCITKAYEKILKKVCAVYGINLLEAKIISFLHNNPEKNTAGDISEYRMLSRGNVSQAIDRLIRLGLMARRRDEADRRRVYLYLLPASEPVTSMMDGEWDKFSTTLFSGFSLKEKELYDGFRERLVFNARSVLEDDDK